jgi:hypothetical protein
MAEANCRHADKFQNCLPKKSQEKKTNNIENKFKTIRASKISIYRLISSFYSISEEKNILDSESKSKI